MLLEQIKYQVQTNECVIIPDFGAIVSNYVPARILEGANSRMLPPSKKMVFNERLKHDDGVFVQNIADDLAVSYTEAEDMVKEFVADAKEKIFAGEIFLIDGVGAFSTFDGFSIVFEPALLDTVLIDSFGMSAFQTPIIDNTISRKTVEKKMQSSGGINKLVKSKQFVRVAVIAPIVIALGLWLPMNSKLFKTEKAGVAIISNTDNQEEPVYNNPVEKELMSNVDKKNALMYVENPKQTAVSVAEKVEIKDPIENIEVTEEPVVVAEEVKEVAQPVVVNNSFHIIVGVFSNRANAKNLQDQLKDSGFGSKIFENGGKFKVSLDSYSSKEDAMAELTELATIDSDFFSGAWVFEE